MPLQPAPEDYVKIYTDGACSGNPGPGGWAFIMEHPASGKRLERAGAEPMTTNNRMEITSALQGLLLLKRPCRVEIVTDSQYLAKGMLEWLPGWKANGFRRREGSSFKPLQNEDLWRAVDEQLQRHEIQVVHVKGHSGHPENERCDQMAVAAYKRLMAGTLAAAGSPTQQFGTEPPRSPARTSPTPGVQPEMRASAPSSTGYSDKPQSRMPAAEPQPASRPAPKPMDDFYSKYEAARKPEIKAEPVQDEPLVPSREALAEARRPVTAEPAEAYSPEPEPAPAQPAKRKPGRPRKTIEVEVQPVIAAPVIEHQPVVEEPTPKAARAKAKPAPRKKEADAETPAPKRGRKKASSEE